MQTKIVLLGALGLVVCVADASEPQVCFAPEYDTTPEEGAISTPQTSPTGYSRGSNSGSSGGSGSGLFWYENYEPVAGGTHHSWGGGAAIGHGDDKFMSHLSIGRYTPISGGHSKTKAFPTATVNPTHGYPGRPSSKDSPPYAQPPSKGSPPYAQSPSKGSPPYSQPPSQSRGHGSPARSSHAPVSPSSSSRSSPSRPHSSTRPSSTSCVNSPTNRQCWGQYDINTDYNDITPDTGVTREVLRSLFAKD